MMQKRLRKIDGSLWVTVISSWGCREVMFSENILKIFLVSQKNNEMFCLFCDIIYDKPSH